MTSDAMISSPSTIEPVRTQAEVRHLRIGMILLIIIIILSGSSGILRNVQFGSVTALGTFTVASLALALLVWLAEPIFPRKMVKWLVPFLLFALWAFFRVGRSEISLLGIQNVTLITAFIAVVLLSSREALLSRTFPSQLHRGFQIATMIALTVYSAVLITTGLGSKHFWNARGFALFALMALCWFLARWRTGSRMSLLVSLVIVIVIAASLSRLALGISFVIFALAQVDARTWQGRMRLAAIGLIGCSIFAYAVMNFEPLRERMFEGDLAISIGGLPINAMGRTTMWTAVLDSAQDSLLLGKGAGSSAVLIRRINGLEHPHNDYLRVLHDYGLLGLGLFATALLALLRKTLSLWRTCSRTRTPDDAIHRAAFLALMVVLLSMLADNSLAYPFVMLPVAILVGASFGSAARGRYL